MLDRKKESNTVCSSINSPSNLVNNVLASVHYLGFKKKLLFSPKILGVSLNLCQKVVNTAGGIWWEFEEEWFCPFENFSKLKTAFCEYWTSIKIKISMICVSREYEVKAKMVHEQWLQLKMKFFLLGWIDFWWEGIKIWWGGGKWANFWLVGGTPPSPQ